MPGLGRILIVDDEVELMRVLRESLTRQGFETQGFTSGPEALAALNSQDFDILLTDLMMPEMDGISLLRQALALSPQLVGVVMTGQGTVPTAVEAMQIGAFDYMLKPFKMQVLLPLLARAMEVRRLRLENIQLRDTVAIHNLSQTIAVTLDTKAIIETTADTALQQYEGDEVSVLLWLSNTAANELEIAAVRGKNREGLLGKKVPMQGSIAGWVAEHQEAVSLAGEVNDERFAPLYPRPEIRAAMSVPMQAGGLVIGVLNVSSLRQRQFTPGQVKALTVLASTAASALANGRLYAALQGSEARFKALIENSSDAIMVLDARGEITFASPATTQILGYQAPDLIGSHSLTLFHPWDVELATTQFRECLKRPGHLNLGEFRLRHRAGGWRWVEGTARNLLGDPSVEGVIVNFHDVTERKQAEEAVKTSETKYRELVELASDGIAIVTPSGQITEANTRYREMSGYSRTELLQLTLREIIAAEDVAQTPLDFGPILAGQTLLIERLWRRKDGALLPVEISAKQLLGGNIQAIVRDISERKKAEAALRESQERLRLIVNSAPVVILAVDRQGIFILSEGAGLQGTGLKPGDVVGLSAFDLYQSLPIIEREDKVSPGSEVIRRVLTGETITGLTELNGVYFSNTFTPLRDTESQITGMVGVSVDITESKKAQEALRASERLARSTIDALSAHIAILDEAGEIIAVNRAWRQFAEENSPSASRAKLSEGANYLKACELTRGADSEAAQAIANGIRAVRDGQQTEYLIEYPCHSPTEQRWFVARVTGFAAEGDRRVVVAHENITERKLAGEQIRFQAQLLDSVGQAVIATDLAGTVIYWNQYAETIYGWSAGEALGRNIIDTAPSDASQEQAREIFERLQMGESWSGEFLVRRRDGTVFSAIVADSPVFATDRSLIGVLGITTDISEIKQRERELEAIASVSATVRASQTRAEMVPQILAQLMNLFQAQAAALDVVDPASGGVVTELGQGEWRSQTGLHTPPGAGVSGQILANGQTYLNNSPRDDLRIGRSALTEAIQAIACAPLTVNRRMLGLLWIGRKTEILPVEVKLLASIADIAANGLQRATLHDQTERRLGQLQALSAIDRAIKSSLDLRLTLGILLEHIVGQLQVDAAAVLLLNVHTRLLELAAGRGFRAKLPERVQVRLGEGYAGQAALERKIIRVPNLNERTDNVRLMGALAAESFACYYAVPLVAKGQVQGVLEIFHRAPLSSDDEWLAFLDSLADQAAIAIDNAQLFSNLQRTNVELSLAYNATIEGWSHALDLRDRETEGHSQRVTQLTLDLARAMNAFNGDDFTHIRWGALLHDIGKMGIPDQILLKPGKLTDEEWEIMKRHPTYAFELLSPIDYLKAALDIPYCHHEKWDGTGYPRGLKGEQIPLAARLFAVVDVWDALRSDRPYRAAWTAAKVREHIQTLSGTHFDPKVVEQFLQLIHDT